MKHIPWPSIDNFHTVRKAMRAAKAGPGWDRFKVHARPKVKIHGTNAAIQVLGSDIVCQSRSRILTPLNDNAGFAAWIESRREAILAKLSLVRPGLSPIIFGEWCGPGIQKGVAICQAPERCFAVFGALWMMTDGALSGAPMVVEPLELAAMVEGIPGFYVLPWHSEAIEVDFGACDFDLDPVLANINAAVAEVEACDPWVKATFGVEGVGEGLVYYATDRKDPCPVFKAKGKEHQTVAHTKPAQANPEAAQNARALARLVCTPARMEQGLEAVLGSRFAEVKPQQATGDFIRWVLSDVERECPGEIAAAGCSDKEARKAVSNLAAGWYQGKVTL